jgi:uncharacterized membrane protein YphA (DoxX/SURF4 family)
VPQQVSILGRRLDDRWVSTAARFVIGAVFAVSGFTKVVDIDGTIRAVRNYRLLPEAIVPTVGTALPVLELALAALLLTGLLTRLAAIITVPLSAAFFIGVASAWARGLTIECGCFGNGGPTAHPIPGYVRELVLNAVLMIAAGWLIRHPVSHWSLDNALALNVVLDDDPSTRSIGVQK